MAMYFPYVFEDNYRSGTCLIKIHFGKKYFLWKAKALKQTSDQVMKDLSRKCRLGCPETDLFANVVKYIRRGRIQTCSIEVIMYTEDHNLLIKKEGELLRAGFGTDLCLNISPEPYLPGWINLTQNKAPGAIKKEPVIQSPAKRVEIKPTAKESTKEPKSTTVDILQKSPTQKLRAILEMRNGKI